MVIQKPRSISRQMARSALALDDRALPLPVREKVKTCILDLLACAFEARDLPWSRQAMAAVPDVKAGATIIGTPRLAAAPDAAFVNGTLGHGLVREDMHAASICHHGVVVIPALLALAETIKCSGTAFLAAIVVGYEAGARLGEALISADLAKLYRPTGLVAPIGAALGGSYLLALDEQAATSAVALAANTSSGLNQWPHAGGSEMYFHPGFAARNALTCALLAQAGAFASDRIIEGESGLFAAFRRELPARSIDLFAAGAFEILSVYNKPAPVCNFAQTPCQAALEIARYLGPERSAIETVRVRVADAAFRYPGCNARGPFGNVLQAKMSIQYSVAAVLAYGQVAESNYARVDDPEVLRLASLMELEPDAALTAAFPAQQGAEVEVTLADGTHIGRKLEDVIPASSSDVRTRFREAASAILGRQEANAIEDFVDDLEKTDDAGRLGSLCASHVTSD